ncbi:small lysine-rich protein 1 isoform X1 [Falco naumanni]|uniref:small lysine-rich protein 1 isoform X1 n=1 Tax=Falco naumanni TaxID=148594 RepID=UPI001ADE04CD|nr:small lysine-rich protein 1 isoform X1 [Falco naumanni]
MTVDSRNARVFSVPTLTGICRSFLFSAYRWLLQVSPSAVKSSKPKRGKGKSSKKKRKKMAKEVDILSPAAMLNAYYICHNAPACLAFRGFPWPGSPKKKGKKGQ